MYVFVCVLLYVCECLRLREWREGRSGGGGRKSKLKRYIKRIINMETSSNGGREWGFLVYKLIFIIFYL